MNLGRLSDEVSNTQLSLIQKQEVTRLLCASIDDLFSAYTLYVPLEEDFKNHTKHIIEYAMNQVNPKGYNEAMEDVRDYIGKYIDDLIYK